MQPQVPLSALVLRFVRRRAPRHDSDTAVKGHRSVIRFVLCAPLAAALFACDRGADESNTIHLTIASSHSANLAWIGTMPRLVVPETNRRLEARESPYRIRWTQTYGGSLYKYEHTLEAIEIGLTDMGWVGTLWELSKLGLGGQVFGLLVDQP